MKTFEGPLLSEALRGYEVVGAPLASFTDHELNTAIRNQFAGWPNKSPVELQRLLNEFFERNGVELEVIPIKD